MGNRYIHIDDLVKHLKHIRDLARTSLAPMAMNMTQAQWDDHRINKLSYELTNLIDDLEKEPEDFLVLWVDENNDKKRSATFNDRAQAIAQADNYDSNASKNDSIYVYENDRAIWIDGHEIQE